MRNESNRKGDETYKPVAKRKEKKSNPCDTPLIDNQEDTEQDKNRSVFLSSTFGTKNLGPLL